MKIFIGMQSPTAARIKKVGHMKTLVLNPKWKPLAKVRDLAPNVPGLYMMAFDKPVNYDKGTSRVIYIGSSISIRERLRSHYNNMKVHFIDFVTKGDMGKVFSCFFQVEVASGDELLTIEQMAFDEFAKKFGAQPLGNWMPKTTDLIGEILLGEQSEETKSYIEHVEDDSGEHALSFDEIAEKYDLEYERDEWSPRIMFHPKGTLAKFQKRKKEGEIEKLTKIRMQHIGCWDKDKMLSVLKIAMSLKEDKTKKLKVTRRFISDTSEVPKPHTWGEVAIVLARYLAGTWFPENRTSVEIKHKGELIGKAIIRKSGCDGVDIANVPQRNAPRASWWEWYEQFIDIDEKAKRMAWECHSKEKELPKNAIGEIVEFGDYLGFRLFDRVVAQREKDFKECPEKIFSNALAKIEVG
jgi:hypothetical protein